MAKTVTALVLAAGRSERMGAFKLLLPFRGRSVIETVVDTLLESPLKGVWVILGHRGEAIRQILAPRPVEYVLNADYEEGMFASVQCGFGAVPDATEGVLVCLGDQPGLSRAVVDPLLAAFETARQGILIPTWEGRRGHPVLIHTRYREEILEMEGEQGLRELLWKHPEDVGEVPVADASILQDMDTPEDYRRLARESARTL